MNRHEKHVVFDCLMIVLILCVALVVVWVKREDPNCWTGLYILGLLPVVVADLRKDLKRVQQGESQTTDSL